jgi:hypothetical protein
MERLVTLMSDLSWIVIERIIHSTPTGGIGSYNAKATCLDGIWEVDISSNDYCDPSVTIICDGNVVYDSYQKDWLRDKEAIIAEAISFLPKRF